MYNEISEQVKQKNNGLTTSANVIDNVSLGSVWSGTAYDTLNGYLTIAVNKLWIEIGNLQTFTNAMSQLEKYKQNKEKIEALTAQMNSLPDDEEYDGQRAALAQQIRSLVSENETLRAGIVASLSSISATSPSVSQVSFSFGETPYKTDIDLNYDVYELLAAYQNRSGDKDGNSDPILMKLNDGASLYEYYNQIDDNGNVIEGSGEAYIKSVLAQVQSESSGREAAVNSALAMLKLAADKGVKLDYEHKGTSGISKYVQTADVVSGVDCNPFVSWAVDKGTANGFQWRPVEGFHSVGEKCEDWTMAQPGDVFVKSNDSGRHVGMIVENDPENGYFITAEASGSGVGIILQTRSYSSMGGYQVRDMTNVYNNTENTDRDEAFGNGNFKYGRETFTITV